MTPLVHVCVLHVCMHVQDPSETGSIVLLEDLQVEAVASDECDDMLLLTKSIFCVLGKDKTGGGCLADCVEFTLETAAHILPPTNSRNWFL